MKKRILLFSFSSLLMFILLVSPANAESVTCLKAISGIKDTTREVGGIFEGLIDDSPCCAVVGQCSAEDFAIVAFAIVRIVFAAAGIVALLFFIIGGVFLIISSGNQTYVARGKLILRSAVIGLVIIFLSWIIVNLVVISITGDPRGTLFDETRWDVLRTTDRAIITTGEQS